jgi:hypothetical protein
MARLTLAESMCSDEPSNPDRKAAPMGEQSDDSWERIDWNEATGHPKTAGGFRLVVRGIAPVPTEVRLDPQPTGIAPVDYHGVEVQGKADDPNLQVETPWTIEADTEKLPHGRIGIVLIGATMSKYFPPQEDRS